MKRSPAIRGIFVTLVLFGVSGCGSVPETHPDVKSKPAKTTHKPRPDTEVKAPASESDAGPLDGEGASPNEVFQDDVIPPCGNQVLDKGERCDDGNTVDDDGCSADCSSVDDGYLCRTPGKACVYGQVCGDRRQTGSEECDDWNTTAGDGCSATCKLENNFVCPTPGLPCISSVVCGDGRVTGSETCDDNNTAADDGCSATCEVETGWACSRPGFPCTATCGDGLLRAHETCDDGNAKKGDGCSATCALESGYVCDEPGEACDKTVCGDGVVEGLEPCDDGDNVIVGDGCSPGCHLEPDCSEKACVSRCGDGLILPGDDEQCDDGNHTDADGCNSHCQIENGFTCENPPGASPPDELTLPVLYRDFIHRPADGKVRHPDFEYFGGDAPTLGLVKNDLDTEGKPAYTGLCEEGNYVDTDCPYGPMTTTEENFKQWYRNADGVNIPVLGSLTFARQPDDTYVFDVVSGLFPLDDQGWVKEGSELPTNDHNFGFTTELRTWFEYQGDEYLEFSGDDDVWVFIAGQLAVDIGGLHPRQTSSVTLDEPTATRLGLEVGRVYEIALFHAERHTGESNFKLSLKGFAGGKSTCTATCGDGIVAGDELCDEGEDNGAGYGHCTAACEPGPRCGDAKKDVDGGEECDDGANLTGYSQDGSGCAPGCVKPASCGDGKLDSIFGEQCDLGKDNDGKYGGCNPDCSLASRCGDGVQDEDQGEECDDGNVSSNDECDVECKDVGVGPAR